MDIKLFHFLHEPSRFISQPKGLAAHEIRDRPGEDIHLRTERLHIVTRGKFFRTSEHFPAGSNSGASNDSFSKVEFNSEKSVSFTLKHFEVKSIEKRAKSSCRLQLPLHGRKKVRCIHFLVQ